MYSGFVRVRNEILVASLLKTINGILELKLLRMETWDGAVVRLLAFHQCGLHVGLQGCQNKPATGVFHRLF